MSKRERDLKRKIQEEQQAAAFVYQDFIDTFHNPSTVNKTFVRSGTLYADKEEIDSVGKIYNPKPLIKQQKIDTKSTAIECAKILQESALDKPKKHEKPMSNLDLLKEELKQRHSERGEKDRLKEDYDWDASLNYSEGGDPNTTNLFVANLRSSVTENHLMLEFGAYGPLASVKIMWPRAGDEKSRMSNCGFVAFMSRKDAERALKENKNREDIRLGWGKPVDIPLHPIYIPGELLKYYLPPPQTDLPFSAQPPHQDISSDENELNDLLPKCIIKVSIPLNKRVLALVHRVVEFVIREGPVFEAFIMNREIENPDYNFLFDCKSPVHVYYRWKLFSILNGDGQKSWSKKKFRMFTGGSVWIPPTPVSFTTGMPEELIRNRSKTTQQNTLSDFQCGRLVNLVRNLTLHRKKIAEAMLFCLNHKNAIDDSIEIILESMMDPRTDATKKIARLYLLSDILHNCKSKRYRTNLEEDYTKLVEVFGILHRSYQQMQTACDKDSFKSRISRVLKHWDTYKIMPLDFFGKIEDYSGSTKTDTIEDDNSSIDEPLDGVRLLKNSLKSNVCPEDVTIEEMDSSDTKKRGTGLRLEYFVPSKWDTVDPEEIEAQSMSTEKLYFMELENKVKESEKKTKKKKRTRL